MEENPARPQNMIETTDALEAINVCQSMKNFLFLLIFLGLLLCQIVFWMNHFDLVGTQDSPVPQTPQANVTDHIQTKPVVYLAATTEENETVAERAESTSSIEEGVNEIVESARRDIPEPEVLLERETDRIPAEIPAEHADPHLLHPEAAQDEAGPSEESVLTDKKAFFRISDQFATMLITACNYVILIAALLYSLVLLVCLKVSLAGRLGGISHITRAFFISLFLLVVLIPWQTVLPGVLVGALWQPAAMWGWTKADTSTFWKIMFYGRFCGAWFVAVWLLLWAQGRSAKWARATLRRLGVVK